MLDLKIRTKKYRIISESADDGEHEETYPPFFIGLDEEVQFRRTFGWWFLAGLVEYTFVSHRSARHIDELQRSEISQNMNANCEGTPRGKHKPAPWSPCS